MTETAAHLRVVISYRREETADAAGRLYDALETALGEDAEVFVDIDTIPPGVDFRESIDGAVASCDVLIALIGRSWLTIEDRTGRRRLDQPHDFVRLEIEAALKRGIPVIPALVGGAPMPAPEDLPDSVSPLAFRQAITLSADRWRDDVARVVRALRAIAAQKAAVEPETTPQAADAGTGPVGEAPVLSPLPPGRPSPSVPTPAQPAPRLPGVPHERKPPAGDTSPREGRAWNRMAVASLVLAIVWLAGAGSVLAIALGFLGKAQIDRGEGAQQGRGAAIAGIALGFAGTAVLGWLVFLWVVSDGDVGPIGPGPTPAPTNTAG